MEHQQYFIKGRRVNADDHSLQEALATIYGTPERPRCMCQPGGVEMYIARLGDYYVVKRLPDKGSLHHPSCPSFEPDPSVSGLGSLWHDAVQEHQTGEVDLRFAFPMKRMPMRSGPQANIGPREPPTEVTNTKARMGLLGFLHYIWERAGFNRYVPAMAGRRNYKVFWKYGRAALANHHATGVDLGQRVYIPEPFAPDDRDGIVERRRRDLARLHASDDDTSFRMMIVVGEFKEVQEKAFGHQVMLKHMPDCPLFIEGKTWTKMRKLYAPLFEAMEAGTELPLRMIMVALIYAKREYVYQIDRLAMMLVTADTWIPVEGTHELDLIKTLVSANRSFYKPLRFDAKNAAVFANALLLDTGKDPTPLHVVGMEEAVRVAKEKALKSKDETPWVWHTEKAMPPLPPIARYRQANGTSTSEAANASGSGAPSALPTSPGGTADYATA